MNLSKAMHIGYSGGPRTHRQSHSVQLPYVLEKYSGPPGGVH